MESIATYGAAVKNTIGSKIRSGISWIGKKIAGGIRGIGRRLGIWTARESFAPAFASLPKGNLASETLDYVDFMWNDASPKIMYKEYHPEGERIRIPGTRTSTYLSPQVAAYRSNVLGEKAEQVILRRKKGFQELKALRQ